MPSYRRVNSGTLSTHISAVLPVASKFYALARTTLTVARTHALRHFSYSAYLLEGNKKENLIK